MSDVCGDDDRACWLKSDVDGLLRTVNALGERLHVLEQCLDGLQDVMMKHLERDCED